MLEFLFEKDLQLYLNDTQIQVFSSEICENLKKPFFKPIFNTSGGCFGPILFQSSFSQRHIFGKDEQTNKQKTGKISSATLLT